MICGYKMGQVVTPSPDKTSISPHNTTTKKSLIQCQELGSLIIKAAVNLYFKCRKINKV